MGNAPGKPHARPSKAKKYLQLKGADKPDAPGKPYLATDAEASPDVLTIKWDAPASDGGTTLTGYLVEHRRTGSPHWVKASPLKVHATELTLSGLEPGWRYQFRVFAENLIGLSEPSELSEPLTVTLQRAAITPPRFVKELVDTVALENEKVEFVAHFVGQPAPKVCWFKDGFEIFSSRRTRILTESDRSVLTIHQSAICDEGEIKCTATNKAGHVSTKARLVLEAPPSIRLPRQYEEGLLFEIGDVIKLKVSVAGLPPPLIFWTHDGESLQENERYEIENDEKTSTLRVAEALRGDRGEYQIKAVNKLGSDVASFLVTVTDKPSPPSRARVVMTLGRSVTLSWNTPDDDGGCKIGNYIIEYYRLGWNVWLKAATSRQLTTILGDLIEGSEYKFRVKAESPFGVSEPSEESELIFIPDPKRGITEPAGGRSRSQPREIDAPVAARRKKPPRSQSSNRTGYDQHETDEPLPTRPDRFKGVKSPPKTPDRLSPKPERKQTPPITINKAIFDRASDVQYGSPDLKVKKATEQPAPLKQVVEVKPPPQRPNQSLQDSIKNTIQVQEKQKAKSPSPAEPKTTTTDKTETNKPQVELPKVATVGLPVKRETVLDKPEVVISAAIQREMASEQKPKSLVESVDERRKNQSPSPLPAFSDGERSPRMLDRRRPPRLSSRDNSENLGGSTEFVMVLYPGVNESDMGSTSDYVFELEHGSVAPPLSLSAPELGTEPPPFDNLRTSASSTELLHERAMVRFYQEALAEEEALRRRLDERRTSLIPTIRINNRNEEDAIGLERKHSLRRRLSAGGGVPQQVLLAQKRQSWRNSNEFSDVFDAKGKLTVDEKRELMRDRQRSRSEEKEEEEFERVRQRMADTQPPKKKISVVQEEAWEFDDEELYEESLSEEESSEEEERYREEAPKIREIVMEDEDITYHPRMTAMLPQKSKFDEPFEILTKPAKLPDANFVPKPILKKKDNGDGNTPSPKTKFEPLVFPQGKQATIENKPETLEFNTNKQTKFETGVFPQKQQTALDTTAFTQNQPTTFDTPVFTQTQPTTFNTPVFTQNQPTTFDAPVFTQNQAKFEPLVLPQNQQNTFEPVVRKPFAKEPTPPPKPAELPQTKPETAPSFTSDVKKHDTSAIASVAGLTAAGILIPQEILHQKEAEEAKVVIDHYGEIVRSVKQQHAVVPSSVKNLDSNPIREALRKAAALQAALHHSDEEEEEEEPIVVKRLGNGRSSAFDERFKQMERKLETTASAIPPRSATPIFKQAQVANKNGDLFSDRGREVNRYGVESGMQASSGMGIVSATSATSGKGIMASGSTSSGLGSMASSTASSGLGIASSGTTTSGLADLGRGTSRDRWNQSKYVSEETTNLDKSIDEVRGREQSRFADKKRGVSESKSPHRNAEATRRGRKSSPSLATARKPSARKSSPPSTEVHSRSSSSARGKTRKNSTSKPPSRSSSRPPSRSSSKPRQADQSPDRNFLAPKRAPKMCEIMTQTSTCLETYAIGTQSTPIEEVLKEKAQIKVRTTMDYTTDLAMFAVACWVFIFGNELYALPVLLVAVYRQLIVGVKSRIPAWLKKRWNREKKE